MTILDPDVIAMLRSLGDRGFFEDLIALFQHDSDDRLGKLQEAVTTGASGVVQEQAHALKGAAGNVGAREVAARAAALEAAAKTGDLSGAQSLLDELVAAVAAARTAFQQAD